MPGDPTPGSLAQKDASTLGNMICRDFLRGVCYRAGNCKFLHSEQHAPATSNQLPVCRDYQSGTCNRRNCKYAHIYSSSGFYDPSTMMPVPQGGFPRTPQSSDNPRSVPPARNKQLPYVDQMPPPHFEQVFKTRAGPNDPLCKDFQNGYCQRGQSCRYKHVTIIPEQPAVYHNDPNSATPTEPRHYPFSAVNNNSSTMMYPTADPHGSNYLLVNPQPPAPQQPISNNPQQYTAPIPTKRPYIAASGDASISNGLTSTKADATDVMHEVEMLRSENARLNEELSARRAEIESLKSELSRYQFKPHAADSSADQIQNPMNPNNYQRHSNSPHSQKSPTKTMYNQNTYAANPQHYNN